MVCTITAVVGRVTEQDCEIIVDQLADPAAPHDSINADVLLTEGEELRAKVGEAFAAYQRETERERLYFGDSLLTRARRTPGAKTIVHLHAPIVQDILTPPKFNPKRLRQTGVPSAIDRYSLRTQYREVMRVAAEEHRKTIAFPFLSADFGCNLWHAQITALQSLLGTLPASFERIVFVSKSEDEVNEFKKILRGHELVLNSSSEADRFCETQCNEYLKVPRQPSNLPPTAVQLRLMKRYPDPPPFVRNARRTPAVPALPTAMELSLQQALLDKGLYVPLAGGAEALLKQLCSITAVVGSVVDQMTEAVVGVVSTPEDPSLSLDPLISALEGPDLVTRVDRAFEAYKTLTDRDELIEGDSLYTRANFVPGAKLIINVLNPRFMMRRAAIDPSNDDRYILRSTYREIMRAAMDTCKATSIAMPLLACDDEATRWTAQITSLQAVLSLLPARFNRVVFVSDKQEDVDAFKEVMGGLEELLITTTLEAEQLSLALCDNLLKTPRKPIRMESTASQLMIMKKKIITLDGELIDEYFKSGRMNVPLYGKAAQARQPHVARNYVSTGVGPSSTSSTVTATATVVPAGLMDIAMGTAGGSLPDGPSLGRVLKKAVRKIQPEPECSNLNGPAKTAQQTADSLIRPRGGGSKLRADDDVDWTRILETAEKEEIVDRIHHLRSKKRRDSMNRSQIEVQALQESASSTHSTMTPSPTSSCSRRKGRVPCKVEVVTEEPVGAEEAIDTTEAAQPAVPKKRGRGRPSKAESLIIAEERRLATEEKQRKMEAKGSKGPKPVTGTRRSTRNSK